MKSTSRLLSSFLKNLGVSAIRVCIPIIMTCTIYIYYDSASASALRMRFFARLFADLDSFRRMGG